ncbi:MAG: hypothetical protein ACUVXI_04450 [bacterium]
MRRGFIWNIFLIGFTSTVAQVILVREAMVSFYGNELSMGVVVASWLVWVALGSFLGGRWADRMGAGVPALALCQVAVSVLFPASVFALRSGRAILGVHPGEILGFSPMFLLSSSVLAPLCVVLGFWFVVGCRVLASEMGSEARGAGSVYFLEGLGAGLGGVAFSFLLVRLMFPFQIVASVCLVDLASAFLLLLFHARRPVILGAVGVLLVCGALASAQGIGLLEERSLALRWRGFDLVESRDSIYGNLASVRQGDQYSLYENGVLMFTGGDEFSAENSVLIPLLSHPEPRSVLLIGGGVGGGLRQALKFPTVERVDYVELDPTILRVGGKYIPPADSESLNSSRVHLKFVDGRLFVKRTREKYDVVILNLPNPYTAQLNRFYTLEFFREVEGILGDGGILGFALPSSENFVSEEQARFLRSIYATLRRVFPEVVVFPGDPTNFLACRAEGILTYDHRALVNRLHGRGVSAKFVNEYYLPYRLTPDRVGYLLGRLRGGGDINRDFRPVCYYYDTVLWSTRFDSPDSRFLRRAFDLNPWWIALALGVGVLALGLRGRGPILVSVGATGFAEITSEVVLVVAFQVIYGYAYYLVGIVLASFMMGLTAGGWLATRRIDDLRFPAIPFAGIQLGVSVYPLVLLLLFPAISGVSARPIPAWEVGIFSSLMVVVGFLGGAQFPLANRLYLEGGRGVGRSAGFVNGFDLVGSCFGALFSTVLLIPLLGISGTCAVASALNFGAFALIALSPRFKGLRRERREIS